MNLAIAQDKRKAAAKQWVVVDLDKTVSLGDPYSLDGHPCISMPEKVEYYLDNQKISATIHNRVYFGSQQEVADALAIFMQLAHAQRNPK